jgi:hypothetical protein
MNQSFRDKGYGNLERTGFGTFPVSPNPTLGTYAVAQQNSDDIHPEEQHSNNADLQESTNPDSDES